MADFLTIASGFSVTSGLAIVRSDLKLAVWVPRSMNAGELRLQCAQTSGASGVGDAWADVQWSTRAQGFGAFCLASLGGSAGPIFVTLPDVAPTPYVRLSCVTSQTMTVSFTVFPYRAG